MQENEATNKVLDNTVFDGSDIVCSGDVWVLPEGRLTAG